MLSLVAVLFVFKDDAPRDIVMVIFVVGLVAASKVLRVRGPGRTTAGATSPACIARQTRDRLAPRDREPVRNVLRVAEVADATDAAIHPMQ